MLALSGNEPHLKPIPSFHHLGRLCTGCYGRALRDSSVAAGPHKTTQGLSTCVRAWPLSSKLTWIFGSTFQVPQESQSRSPKCELRSWRPARLSP